MANWLDKYEQGGLVLKKKTKDNYGKKANPNDVQASVGPDFVGLGYNIKGRDYSPAWGGRFAMGGALPGSVGFTYARVAGSAPANGKYTKKTKASAQNGTEMKFYQEGLDFKPKSISQDGKTIPNEKEEIKPITTSQRNIGQAAAWKVIEAIKANTPYQLSEDAVKSGIDPSLTCIGGVCNVYKDLGVDFSGVGNEKQGVRESRTKGKVVEYNPTFDKNYKAAGFEKVKGRPIEFNELTDIIQKGNLNPGDFIQYYNEKGIPDHTNIVLGSNPDGSVEVYNSYKHGQATRGESKEPYVYTLNPSAQGFKGKKINVFRVGDQKATEIRDASANNPSGITNTWFNYTMEKQIQRRMKMLEEGYQELAKHSDEPIKKLTPLELRKAAIDSERRLYESNPVFKRNLEIINTVDFSESPKEAMYRTLNKQKNGGWLDNYSEPIRDDMGQWAHPGEITQIGSNEITMKGVDYPVLGISDTGDTKMMKPGKHYKFDGSMVTEYPMAQDGRNLSKELQKEAEERLSRMNRPKSTVSQYTPKKGEAARLDKEKLQRIADENKPLNKFARSKASGNLQDAMMFAAEVMGGIEGASAIKGMLKKAPRFNLAKAATTIEEDNAVKAAVNTASNPVITRGPITAPYKGTTLPYDNIGYKEPATGELAPYISYNRPPAFVGDKPFKSEINWENWNKEIPNNARLMDEYEAIEQSAKYDGSWMKNTDGSEFKGSPEQFVQQQSENFKNAFGKSKLVNPDGSPIMLYHGAPERFDVFDPALFQRGDAGYSGVGIYTTPSKTTANSYAHSSRSFIGGKEHVPTVYELYGQANNPISAEELINEGGKRDLFNFNRTANWKGEIPVEERLTGYDAAIANAHPNVSRVRPWNDAYEIVFPTNRQLKSAVGNNGMFDMNNPNIYKALLPAVGIGAVTTAANKKKNGGWLNKYK
jgi:hypothetical protein